MRCSVFLRSQPSEHLRQEWQFAAKRSLLAFYKEQEMLYYFIISDYTAGAGRSERKKKHTDTSPVKSLPTTENVKNADFNADTFVLNFEVVEVMLLPH